MPDQDPNRSLYDAETPEEDLWFPPGEPEDVDPTLPPLPRADRVVLPDAAAWRGAEDRQGRGRVASITGQARSTLTRENGQPTDSNLAQPSSVILLRARTPICASVF